MLQPTVLAVGLFQEFKGWHGYAVWGALILINGLGRLQTMFRISLPLVWPGIVTAMPLTVSMPRFLGLYIQDWQYLFTVALVAIGPVIILFSIIEKRLIGGLTAGSVKL